MRATGTLPGQRLLNSFVRLLLRTPGLSQIVGGRLVTLYVIGRKSNRRYAIPVAYLRQGDDLLIGSSSGWVRNLETGERTALRLKGRLRFADVRVESTEAGVVRAYGHMARLNRTFARFNKIDIGKDGEPDRDDLRQAWLGGARAVWVRPR